MALILVAEDEPHLCHLLQQTLEKHGHSVLVASDGEEALSLFYAHPFDVALLDVIMPKLTGLEVCRTMRETSDIPILMFTALNTPDYVKQALADLGADDYIFKPTTFKEVVVRIEGLLRRVEWTNNPLLPTEFVIGNIQLSQNPRVLVINHQKFYLNKTPYEILKILLNFVDQPVAYDALLSGVWGRGSSSRISNKKQRAKLYNAIYRLRILIEDDPLNPQYIQSISGFGYIFKM